MSTRKMKSICNYLAAAAMCALPLGAMAEVNIDFESADSYKSLGVYDAWEQSPFQSGTMIGNWGITANPDTELNEITGQVPNESAKVLGAQRSRFGSNRFGVRVDLNEPWPTHETVQYVHVMIHKPKEGRVMLVGLGSREERLGQNPYTEQFWQLSSNAVEADKWYDAVFPIKTNHGVNIRSLVVVPDCESPHALAEDFLFYVDNIIVDNSPLPRISNDYYPITGDKANTKNNRGSSRETSAVSIKIGNETQTASVNQPADRLLYQDCTSKVFYAKAGDVITPSITWGTATDWMHSYCYIDFNNNGKFEFNADGSVAGSDLVAYNHFSGKNSKGETTPARQVGTVGTMPSFTLPADIKPGMYRMRFKIDWDCVDPAGNSASGNMIDANGGSITDIMLCVSPTAVTLNDNQLNGEVLLGDGTKLVDVQVPAHQEVTIKSAPEAGFHNGGIDVRIGFNLYGEATDKYGNPQYSVFSITPGQFNPDGTYTLPANKVNANMLFMGRMVEDGSGSPVSEGYFVNFSEDLQVTRNDRKFNKLTLTPTKGQPLEVSGADNTDNTVYYAQLGCELQVEAGATVNPVVDYTGNAMHTYHYIDLNENGVFATDLNEDGTPAAGGELLSYSCLNNKNSKGETVQPGMAPSQGSCPIVIPADTKPGVYRARFKIDWDCSDPGGNTASGNLIDANGGYIVDYMVHVYDPATVNLSAVEVPEAGNPVLTDGREITAEGLQLARNTEALVTEKSTGDVYLMAIKARAGYWLDSSAYLMGHTRWTETQLDMDGDGNFILPAELLDRPVRLYVQYEGMTSVKEIELGKQSGAIYDLRGIRVDKPRKGQVYIVDGHKFIVG